MTLGEATGALLAAYIDGKDLDAPRFIPIRRRIMATIPIECRYVTRDHKLAYMTIIQAVMDKINREGE